MLRLSGPLCPHLQKVSPARPAARAGPTQTKVLPGVKVRVQSVPRPHQGAASLGPAWTPAPVLEARGGQQGPHPLETDAPILSPLPDPSQPTDPAPQTRHSIGEEGRCLGSPRKQAGWSSPDWGRPPHCRPLSQCGPPQTCPPVSTQASSGRRPRLPDPCPERCTSQGLRMSAEFQGS